MVLTLPFSGPVTDRSPTNPGEDNALPRPGEILEGRYCVESAVGSGGMGVVFCARHTTIGNRVALKVLAPRHSTSKEHVGRFLQEARAASRIEHPCMVRITDFGHTPNGSPFFAMEYLEGEDLGQRLRRSGPLSWESLGPIALQICGALHAAHVAGIVHRDIKPSNIFVIEGTHDIKVLDFGIAKVSDNHCCGGLTHTGYVMGTAGYLSPEAVLGQPVDHRADIYSLGVMLYQLISGSLPFKGENELKTMKARLQESARTLPSGVPQPVVELICTCIERNPEDRFQSVGELFDNILVTLPTRGEAAIPMMEAVSRAKMTKGSWSSLHLIKDRSFHTLSYRRPIKRRPGWLTAVVVGVLLFAVMLTVMLRPHHSASIDPEHLASFGALPEFMLAPGIKLDNAKIALGRRLFSDPRLSKDGDISCASCHPLDRYGADGFPLATGHAHLNVGRNAPTVYNAAGHVAQGWSGVAETVEAQVQRPLFNPHEMANTQTRVLEALYEDPEYPAQFVAAFADDPEPMNMQNLSIAIGAFERTLVTPSPWDRFLGGEIDALAPAERRGFNTFVEVGCVQCHSGTYVGGSQFQKLGLLRPWPNSKDRGRYEDTGQDTDWMIFKVAGLRNVAETAPYFHDGTIATLDTAVRMMAKHQLDRTLSDDEVEDLVAFLGSLTGELPASVRE